MKIMGVEVELPGRNVSSNPSQDEVIKLLEIAIGLRVKNVFEIGTGNGSTIVALASIPAIERAWTLDIPKGSETKWPILATDHNWVGLEKIEFPENVEQLWGDSATFDFSPYKGMCDMVFVMGSHSKKYIFNDIAAALRLVSRKGVVVWHGGTPDPVELTAAEWPLIMLGDRMAIIWK